jgi:hypothetical protein
MIFLHIVLLLGNSVVSNGNSVELTIVGVIAKDPESEEVIVPKDGVFVFKKEDVPKLKKRFAAVKKKYAKIEKHYFSTTIEVPAVFAPAAIGNFFLGFKGLTLTKILNTLKDKENACSKSSSKSSSKSPDDGGGCAKKSRHSPQSP